MFSEYSVLMSVYYKENAGNLRTAMESIWQQTVSSDDFVLVCDGLLTAELDAVISLMKKEHGDRLQVIRLKENKGLGNALNIGIKQCRHELVARMDSDDISKPYRCEKQLEVFSKNPELDVVSAVVEEFVGDTGNITARRELPETHDEILRFSKSRNPFNHPCVMYKKSAVENAGGYLDLFLLEDYYLWIRMLQKKCRGYNLQESLLWMRAGSDMYKRRAGWRYVVSQHKLFSYMKEVGYITEIQFIRSILVRTISSMLPNRLREYLYKHIVRKLREKK